MEAGRVTEYAEDGALDDLFDHIDDLLDFPNDDELLGIGMAEQLIPFSPLSLPLQGENNDDIDGLLNCNDNNGSSNVLFGATNAIVSANNFITNHEEDCNPATNLQQQQQIEEELDIIPLEWMSQFLEESDSLSLSFPNQFDDGKAKEDCFRTSSPISVLEQPKSQCVSNGNGNSNTKSFSYSASSSSSSSSSSASSFSYCNSTKCSKIQEEEEETAAAAIVGSIVSNPIISAVPARTRTKRPRPIATVVSHHPHPHITIPIPVKQEKANSIITPTSDPESIGESHPAPTRKRNKTKKQMNAESACLYGSDGDDEYIDEEVQAATNVRKCQHCQITKTPQWRAGPMGPKTLCNACGVRYKSGRLFPEYRPAASPTFVPSIHSNSHKKVVEMRNKTINATNSCDLLNYIRKSQKISPLN